MTLKYVLSRLALILLGVLLFSGVELVLRLLWEPPQTPDQQLLLSSIDPFRRDGDHFVTRESFRAALRETRFPVDKNPETFRVFCLGGSATFGYPYEASYSWPATMQRALNTVTPERSVEVINLGGTSYGTSRVLGLLRGIVKYAPDLIIIYSGNNEFVEDSYRVQAVSKGSGEHFIEQLYLARALSQILPVTRQGVKPEIIPVESGDSREFFFSPTVDGTIYQPTVDESNAVLARYQVNLQAMAELAREEGIPLLFATVASNLGSWPPDSGGDVPLAPPQRAAWQRMITDAEQATADGKYEKALLAYRSALELYAGNAATNFALGSLLLQTGDPESALPFLVKARDLDPAPVRASSDMNAAVRSIAAEQRIPLADVEAMAISDSPNHIPGDMLFVDNVHPTPRGNVHIARSINETLFNSDLLPSSSGQIGDRFWADEYARSDIAPTIDANVAFTWGQVYLRKGMLGNAEALLRSAIDQGYQHPSVIYYLADTLARKGEYTEAYDLLSSAVRNHPDYHEPLPLLARLAASTGRTDVAIETYTRILNEGTPDADIYFSLALLLLQKKQTSEAGQIISQGLNRFPADCSLNATRGRAYELEGDQAKAETVYIAVVEKNPTCQAGWENLGLLQMNQRRFQEASATFAAALDQPGTIPSHHLNLGLAYHYAGGQPAKAYAQFRIVMQQAPELGRYIPPSYRNEILAEMENTE